MGGAWEAGTQPAEMEGGAARGRNGVWLRAGLGPRGTRAFRGGAERAAGSDPLRGVPRLAKLPAHT